MPSVTMPSAWTGYYLDGNTAARHQVTVHASAHALLITCEDGCTMTWPYDAIRQTLRAYEDGPVRLEYVPEPAQVLVIADPDFLTALHDTAPAGTTHLHNPLHYETREHLTILAGVAALIIGGILYLGGIQSFAWAIAPWVPPMWETKQEKAFVDEYAPQSDRCLDQARMDTLNKVVDALRAQAPQLRRPIRLIVVRNPESNALAGPGSTIVVYSGLLERTENPGQFAGILAHELQHVLRHHTTRMFIEQRPIDFLLFAISNAFSLSEEHASRLERYLAPNQLQNYRKQFEDEADDEMIRMLRGIDINPQVLIPLYRTMKEKSSGSSGVPVYFSTHPSTEDRIKKLEASPTKPGSFLSDVDWKDTRSICHQSHLSTERDR